MCTEVEEQNDDTTIVVHVEEEEEANWKFCNSINAGIYHRSMQIEAGYYMDIMDIS